MKRKVTSVNLSSKKGADSEPRHTNTAGIYLYWVLAVEWGVESQSFCVLRVSSFVSCAMVAYTVAVWEAS